MRLGTVIAGTGNAQDLEMNKWFLFFTAIFAVIINCGWQVVGLFVQQL